MSTPIVVNKEDEKWGIIAMIVSLVLTFVVMLMMSFTIADPPPRDIPLEAEMAFEEMDMRDLVVEAGGAGGGTPSDDQIAPPSEQVQNVITQKESKTAIHTGKSNKTNTNNNSNNTATTTKQSTNPFGGGDGGGEGGGNGPAFGPDSGKEGKTGKGNGSGEGRIRYNNISVDDISTDIKITVNLQLTINEDGQVVSARNMSGTTTTDQRIINQVIAASKAQLKFNKEPGAGLQKVFYTAVILPN